MENFHRAFYQSKYFLVPLCLLALAGLWGLIWWIYYNFKSLVHICCAVLKISLLPKKKRKKMPVRYGEWAVVTGSTDGIGKQYAFELAKKGMNIVLVSRTEAKLIEVSKKIESMYPVKTKYIVVDFGMGKEIYDGIRKRLQILDVGILVNNVGKMYEFPDDINHVPEDLIWQIININVGAATMMSRIVIPQMKIKRRGIIVNISSGSESQPMPLTNVYGATKIYLRNFTLALSKELEEYNIQVQLVSPMFVQTKMNLYAPSMMKEGLFTPNVESYVRQAVFTLGKSSETTGYWSHGLQTGFFKLLPVHLRAIVAFRMNKKFRDEYKPQFTV